MTEAAVAPKAKKEPTVVTKVTLTDGREVGFAGKRTMVKDYELLEGGVVKATFDFLNGETRSITVSPSDALYSQFAAHGILQKIGDETAGDENVDDKVVSIDAIMQNLAAGKWGVERKAGDGFAGASIVVKAIMEATGKDMAFVKGFLEKKLEAGKEAGLTRQKLYASFKAPGSKTAPIIERLEREKVATAPAINPDDALAEMSATA